MRCIVYRTDNLLNGMYYFGVHKFNPKERDYYLGSGEALLKDIKLLGKNHFVRIILLDTDSEELCYFIEEHLVTKKQVADPQCYNKMIGGYRPPSPKGKKLSEVTKAKMSCAAVASWKDGKRIQHLHTEETKAKYRSKRHSPETREKMSAAKKRYWNLRNSANGIAAIQ